MCLNASLDNAEKHLMEIKAKSQLQQFGASAQVWDTNFLKKDLTRRSFL